MTIEELRDTLSELIEKFPDIGDSEVRVERWETDEPWNDETRVYGLVDDVKYLEDEKILVFEENF